MHRNRVLEVGTKKVLVKLEKIVHFSPSFCTSTSKTSRLNMYDQPLTLQIELRKKKVRDFL